MLQMSMKSGDTEQILDLVDTPEYVLVQFCNMILRHRDLRNPDTRYQLRETVNALKVIAAKERPDVPSSVDRYFLKKDISQVEDLLKQFDTEDANQEIGSDTH